MRRPVTSHEPRALPGRLPSSTTFASVMLSADEPERRFAFVPSRFSTTSSEESRSPYFAAKAPVYNSKLRTVSGLKALVRPNNRYGLWISTPSMTVRFSSGPPPRTASRLPNSSVAATPGSVCRVRKMFSAPPATFITSAGWTRIVAGASSLPIVAVTSTVS